MGSDQLQKYLEEAAEDLPTIPAVATEVISALDDPETPLSDVRELIEQDPALAARVLKVANSAVYSFASEIRGLEQAISLLGARPVRNLVMAVAMRETYSDFGDLEQMLWEHSAAAGPVSAKLAAQAGLDPDEAFTVGLLHDIGQAALVNTHRNEYAEIFARVEREPIPFIEAERDALGFDHAELGASIAESWGLPKPIIAVIRHHHDPDALAQLPGEAAHMTALVAVSTACLTRLGAGRATAASEIDLSAMPAWQLLGFDDLGAEAILELCQERIEAAKSLTS